MNHGYEVNETPALTVTDLIRDLRDLVLKDARVANLPIDLCPHGLGHRQKLGYVRLNLHGTHVVLEAQR